MVITDTSSAEPQHTGPHYMWASGCDKAAQESKVTFFKHKLSGHTAPIRMGQTGWPGVGCLSFQRKGGGN